MTQVVSFEGYTPPARFDTVAWTDAKVQEATAAAGPWTLIDTLALDPVDADPTDPATRNLTTENATDPPGLWYRIIFVDAGTGVSQPTAAVQNLSPQPGVRDLCTLADVISYVPGYVSNVVTDAKLQQLLSAESELIHDECGREIVAMGDQPTTRQFEISKNAVGLRQVDVGDLASMDGLEVSILNWDGTVNRTIDLSAILALYEGDRQPTRGWEPVTALYFPWGRPQMPVFIAQQALELTGTFGFPSIPGFIREACAKRVILRYVSDVAHAGTDFAAAVDASNLNLAAMFESAQDAIGQLSGRVVLA